MKLKNAIACRNEKRSLQVYISANTAPLTGGLSPVVASVHFKFA